MAFSIPSAHLGGLGRRDFVKVCFVAAAAAGLPAWAGDDPGLACAVHAVDAVGHEIARVTVA